MKSIHQERYAILINTLIKHRKEKGLTQEAVAYILNKPQSYIAKIEGKDRKLDVIEFIDFCDALEIKPSHIIEIITSSKS